MDSFTFIIRSDFQVVGGNRVSISRWQTVGGAIHQMFWLLEQVTLLMKWRNAYRCLRGRAFRLIEGLLRRNLWGKAPCGSDNFSLTYTSLSLQVVSSMPSMFTWTPPLSHTQRSPVQSPVPTQHRGGFVWPLISSKNPGLQSWTRLI